MKNPRLSSMTSRAAGLVLALAAAAGPAGAQPPLPVLTGQWESVAPEASGPMFATRRFTFDGDRWRVTFRAFGDAAAKVPLFTLEVGGAYVIGGASAKVAGAWEGNFPALYRRLTADSAAGAGIFANAGCTIRQGQTLALVDKGCGFVPGLMQAMGEYDLIALEDGQLFLGDRAGDLTKGRPERLTPHPLRRH